MQRYSDVLRSYDIKPSFTRLMVYQYLKDTKSHRTADEIYQALYPEMPTLSKTTVYNTLHLFIQKHLATMIVMDETETRYDLIRDPHAHFKCVECSRIFDIDVVPPEVSESFLRDYKVHDAQLLYRGVCPRCQKHVQ